MINIVKEGKFLDTETCRGKIPGSFSCSVTKACPTLFNPTDCSPPGFHEDKGRRQPLTTQGQRPQEYTILVDTLTSDSHHPKFLRPSVCLFVVVAFVVQSLSHVRFFCGPMDCTPSGSSVPVIAQARTPRRGLPFPSPQDLLHPGIKPDSTAPSALAGGFFSTESPGN